MSSEPSTPPAPALPAGMPKQRLDHDFNSAWGSILCFDQLSAITTMNPLWRELVNNRLGFENNYERLLAMYTERFVSFFGGYHPIDFHSATAQAMKPAAVAKLMFWLASFSLAGAHKTTPDKVDCDMVLKMLDWNEVQMETPRWAVLSDSYAATTTGVSSPTPSPASTPSSNPDRRPPHSSESFVVNVSQAISQSELRAHLEAAKEQGCIGIVVETVETQYNGRVLDPSHYARARKACAEKGLVFAVDETLTAVRCGSPFSFQRGEYGDVEPPDVVFFGRALAAQGAAVHFGAPLLRPLGLVGDAKGRAAAVKGWQRRRGPGPARPLASAVLVQAVAAADLAAERELPMVSRLVGRAVRDFVMKHVRAMGLRDAQGEGPVRAVDVLGGLESFVFVRKDVAAGLRIMGAGTAAQWMPWVRWFPRLEMDMASAEVLDAVVGAGSRASRQALSVLLEGQDVRPHWCFCCGNRASGRGVEWCRRCCINVCEHEACVKQLERHKCEE